jgi:hypothetical protein
MQLARRERGAGKVGTIIGLILLIAAIVFAWGFIPARVKVYQLKDSSEQWARRLGTGQIDKRNIENVVLELVKEGSSIGLPVKEKNIRVFDDHRAWYIELKYTVELDFIVYKHPWQIDQKVESPKIEM